MGGFPLFQQLLLAKPGSVTHMTVSQDNAQISTDRISAETRELAEGPQS